MTLTEFLNNGRSDRYLKEYDLYLAAPPIICKDGYEVSVQCSSSTYCLPRENFEDCEGYTHFELGFPNQTDELLNEYGEDVVDLLFTIYPFVPRSVVEALIEKHGGLK